MLLSLPNPSSSCIQYLKSITSGLLWLNKPLEIRKEILEADIGDVGLKLHSFFLYNAILKLSWLKRFLSSRGRWIVFPEEMELEMVLEYRTDYLECTPETTSNPKCLKLPWESYVFKCIPPTNAEGLSSYKGAFRVGNLTDRFHNILSWKN